MSVHIVKNPFCNSVVPTAPTPCQVSMRYTRAKFAQEVGWCHSNRVGKPWGQLGCCVQPNADLNCVLCKTATPGGCNYKFLRGHTQAGSVPEQTRSTGPNNYPRDNVRVADRMAPPGSPRGQISRRYSLAGYGNIT